MLRWKPRPGPSGSLPELIASFIAWASSFVMRPAARAASTRSIAAAFSAASSFALEVPRRPAASFRNAWRSAAGSCPEAAIAPPTAPPDTATTAAPMIAVRLDGFLIGLLPVGVESCCMTRFDHGRLRAA